LQEEQHEHGQGKREGKHKGRSDKRITEIAPYLSTRSDITISISDILITRILQKA
jgi:hypothetical protein